MALSAQLTHFGIHTVDLDRMVDFYRACGVDGLTILGMMGEAPKLDTDEALNLDLAREQVEKLTLREALRRTGGNATHAARLVGVSRATFYRLLEKHRLLPVAARG